MKAPLEARPGSKARLGYVRYGNGPVHVLVMHDWLADHSSYEAVMPWLDGHAFTYVFVDLRGYGQSIELAGEFTIKEIAADCLMLVDQLGWRRFHVIGHSMTGMITQRIAADVPSRVASAIAVCPVSAAGNRLSPEALAFFVSTVEDDGALRRLFKFVSGGLSDAWADRKVQQSRDTVAPACRRRYLEMLVKADFVDDVRGLETPYLIIIGDKDPGLDSEAMRRTFLAWHPNASLHVIPNCGHYPMQECPPYFATVIEDFLKREVPLN
ncbi:Pimeloyl-[acyl-carrier protein] methyl ester esterase [Paraburkholderia sediminicola]|uniref:Pimeloyl-[acyl-carrier protein] methyl ester esterase n=2 Tax=Paraburkholderia sediminicola TaxID=458836 RepID=A0A6J4ZQ73_9BURK|nr:Pimeloyl-[acyl-carrier protein] methyl ester esterase [Paraburkholderia sediminicola]